MAKKKDEKKVEKKVEKKKVEKVVKTNALGEPIVDETKTDKVI